jgi:trimethylamine--corrinoid protein Co-methyltransferase
MVGAELKLSVMLDRLRRRRKAPETPKRVRTRDYRQLRHPFAPQPVFSEDRVASMHDTALRVLEELGVKVLLPEAREIFARAGATVDDEMMVKIGRDVVEEAVRTAPSSFHFQAPNKERSQQWEHGALMMAPGAGCPNVTDLERGRRAGSLNNYIETLKLQQSFDAIHQLGPSAEPQDIPIQLRHYEQMKQQLILCDKPLFMYSRGTKQVEEQIEMIKIARQWDDAAFEADVKVMTIINTNSPRMIDNPMAQGIIDFARANQLSIITPFCLAGAMAPITVTGALVLQHAEALAAITLGQLIRPGAPMAYGGFASNVDMKSGSPAFGTPEHVQACLGSGQLARHINLPWRSASGSAGQVADAQSVQENALALWGAFMAGATLCVHSAGWLEGGLTFGYEKFIIDMEAVNTLAELCNPIAADDDDMAFRAIADVQPGGHFFATEHTMERYQTAFYPPVVADLTNIGQWEDAGAPTTAENATKVWKEVLAEFTPPAACEGVEDALAPYIEAGIKAGGAPPID